MSKYNPTTLSNLQNETVAVNKINENLVAVQSSIENTLSESRKNDEKIDFDKKHVGLVKKGVGNILKSKKIKTKDQIKKYFKQKK